MLVSIDFFSFSQEPEVEICASMLDALNECIQVCNIHLSEWKIFLQSPLFELYYITVLLCTRFVYLLSNNYVSEGEIDIQHDL